MRVRGFKIITAFIMSLGVYGMQANKEIIKSDVEHALPLSAAVRAGGLIYLSGALAVDEQGRFAGGDIREQTHRTLRNLQRVLQAGNSTLADVAAVTVYLKNKEDFRAMNEVYATYWTSDPPTRTTIQAHLVLPEALVEIAMVAIPSGTQRKVIHPSDWVRSPNPYSYGIQSGDTLFLSGLVARDTQRNTPLEGDIAVQTQSVLNNGKAILEAAGMSLQDVVSCRVYLSDTAHFQAMNTAYRAFFPKDPPARATVVAGLMAPQYLVEITMTAVKESGRTAITTPDTAGNPGRPNPNLSSAIRVANRLYISGMLGINDTTRGDAQAQTAEILRRIGRTLQAAGLDWPHVVDTVVYLTDMTHFTGMNTAYGEVFTHDFPARATVQSGLVAPDGLVEIMVTAVK